MPQFTIGFWIRAMTLVSTLGLGSVLLTTLIGGSPADMRIEPTLGTAVIGEPFTVHLIVESYEPVNAFQGLLKFDPTQLRVRSIDYNTSIADLWAEQPWFSNGEGTLNFAGGTTKAGGFVGSGTLITVIFETIATGNASISLAEARILKHDGLGTDAAIRPLIDAIFSVSPEKLQEDVVVAKSNMGTNISVLAKPPSTDLNSDGKQSLADISIFMTHLATQDKHSDFNQDGRVNLKDLSILNAQ